MLFLSSQGLAHTSATITADSRGQDAPLVLIAKLHLDCHAVTFPLSFSSDSHTSQVGGFETGVAERRLSVYPATFLGLGNALQGIGNEQLTRVVNSNSMLTPANDLLIELAR